MYFHNILKVQHGTVRAVIYNYGPIWSKYGAVTEEKIYVSPKLEKKAQDF